MLGALGEVGQPAAEHRHSRRHGELARRAAKPRRPSEQAHETDRGLVRHHKLRSIEETGPCLVPAGRHVLGRGAEALDIRHHDTGQLGREREPLVPVPRLANHQQSGRVAVVADHRGQRRVCLAGQSERHEHQRPLG
jgi:hypothetical protein